MHKKVTHFFSSVKHFRFLNILKKRFFKQDLAETSLEFNLFFDTFKKVSFIMKKKHVSLP